MTEQFFPHGFAQKDTDVPPVVPPVPVACCFSVSRVRVLISHYSVFLQPFDWKVVEQCCHMLYTVRKTCKEIPLSCLTVKISSKLTKTCFVLFCFFNAIVFPEHSFYTLNCFCRFLDRHSVPFEEGCITRFYESYKLIVNHFVFFIFDRILTSGLPVFMLLCISFRQTFSFPRDDFLVF